jgi:hypothetical protein
MIEEVPPKGLNNHVTLVFDPDGISCVFAAVLSRY